MGSDEKREGFGPDAFVTVSVSRELLALLEQEWSAPVQIKILPTPGERATHTMVTRDPWAEQRPEQLREQASALLRLASEREGWDPDE